jgi:hypothetical protein
VEQQLQLVTYDQAMKLAGLRQRVFYERLKESGVPIYADPRDRRRRWILRADVEKLTTVRPERRRAA